MIDFRAWAVIFMLSSFLMLGAVIVIYAVIGDAPTPPCEATPATGWQPPNVQLCPDGLELWECIRTASYRSDI